jgi:hypothetical protein
VRKFFVRSFSCVLASASAMAASVSAFSSANQLPSCTVSGEEVAKVPEQNLVKVRLDSHGNFFAGSPLTSFYYTELDQFRMQPWTFRSGGLGDYRSGIDDYWVVNYYTTASLEEKVCALGRKIAFSETRYNGDKEYYPTFEGVLPKPYTVVREFVAVAAGTYFLSSLGHDTDYVIQGRAGFGWKMTPNSFRLPRTGNDLVPVLRFYGKGPGSEPSRHFYTADPTEYGGSPAALLPRLGSILAFDGATYNNEGVVFLAPRATLQSDGSFKCADAQTVPVTRLYLPPLSNSGASGYRYVTDASVVQSMRKKGWIDQGASFCALPD